MRSQNGNSYSIKSYTELASLNIKNSNRLTFFILFTYINKNKGGGKKKEKIDYEGKVMVVRYFWK